MFMKFIVVVMGILVVLLGCTLCIIGISLIPGMLYRFSYSMLEGSAVAFFALVAFIVGVCVMVGGALICKRREKIAKAISEA